MWAGLALAGCASDPPPLPEAPLGPYRLGTGDSVRLITYGEAQLSGEFRVGDAGTVALPLLGSVQAAGLTTEGLAAAIEDDLKRRNLLRDPSVSAEVVEYRPIFVLGEVAKPGRYPYQPGMSVLTAVALAGGFTYGARQEPAIVQRSEGGGTQQGAASRQARVHPGDIITIKERYF